LREWHALHHQIKYPSRNVGCAVAEGLNYCNPLLYYCTLYTPHSYGLDVPQSLLEKQHTARVSSTSHHLVHAPVQILYVYTCLYKVRTSLLLPPPFTLSVFFRPSFACPPFCSLSRSLACLTHMLWHVRAHARAHARMHVLTLARTHACMHARVHAHTLAGTHS